MRIYPRWAAAATLLAALCVCCVVPLTAAQEFSGVVSAVPHGDTITVNRDGAPARVRIFGIDCPEAGQPYAEEAVARTKALALGKTVKVEVVTEDAAGVSVGRVTLPDSVDLGETLVREGLAWWDQDRAKDERGLRLMNAEALLEKRGLWADDTPLAPWDYRTSHEIESAEYRAGGMEEPAYPPPPAAEEVKSVSASGNAEKTYINVGELDIRPENLDYGTLITRHMPTTATGDNGQPVGLAVPGISQIPYATMLGFRDGDVITGVNGVPVTSTNQVPSLIQQFRDTKLFNVSIVRNGQPTTLTIQIP